MLAFIVQPEKLDEPTVAIANQLKSVGCKLNVVKSLDAVAEQEAFLKASNSLIVALPSADTRADVAEIVRLSPEIAGRAFVLYVIDKISPEDYKSLSRTGCADVADWASVELEIANAVRRLRDSDPDAGKRARNKAFHRLISFAGTRGGPGNTTVAMEAGVYLASRKGKEAMRVAFLDFDFCQNTVCDYLDVAPMLDMAAISENPERLDEYMLNIMASRHASGLDIYASKEPWAHRSQAAEVAVLLLLNRLLDAYDAVIVDIPAHRVREADEILQKSDFVFVTGLFSVPAVRQIFTLLKRLSNNGVSSDRIAAIITDVEFKFFGVKSQRFDLAAALPDREIFYVRRDRNFALDCVDAGVSMLQSEPDRGVCEDMRKIARQIRSVTAVESA